MSGLARPAGPGQTAHYGLHRLNMAVGYVRIIGRLFHYVKRFFCLLKDAMTPTLKPRIFLIVRILDITKSLKKNYLIFSAALLLAGVAHAQDKELFFSEYNEGAHH